MKVPPATSEASIRWPAAASPGGLIGILGIIFSLLLSGTALLMGTGHISLPVPERLAWVGLAIAVALGLLFAFLVYGYVTIGYEFAGEDLIIRWAGRRHVIALHSIQQMVPAADRLGDHPGGWNRFWTGYYVGSRSSPDGEVAVIATLPVRRQLLIITPDHRFAISPERPVLFVEQFGRQLRAQPSEPSGMLAGDATGRLAEAGWTMQYPAVTMERPPASQTTAPEHATAPERPRRARKRREVGDALGRSHVLNDSVAIGLLTTAVLLNVAIVLFILMRYDHLPPSIALHWNVNGDPDRIGSPREIWVIPIITSLVTIANLGLAWSVEAFDRFAARFLLAATCMVQIVAWIALITLIR